MTLCIDAAITGKELLEEMKRSDPFLWKHSYRTAVLAARLASEFGLEYKEKRLVTLAAELHDVGKLLIPEKILHKPGALDDDELEIMKRHAGDGAYILRGKVPRRAVEMIRYHHENMDGTGYLGLEGGQIPLGARIIRICDVYDALVSSRVYKMPWDISRAVAFIEKNAGSLFDERGADLFCKMIKTHRKRRKHGHAEMHAGKKELSH